MTYMASGTFRLKGRTILARAIERGLYYNKSRIGAASNVTRPTVTRFLERPQNLKAIDLETFTNLMIDGLGFSPEEVLNMRMGDIFEFAPSDQQDSATR